MRHYLFYFFTLLSTGSFFSVQADNRHYGYSNGTYQSQPARIRQDYNGQIRSYGANRNVQRYQRYLQQQSKSNQQYSRNNNIWQGRRGYSSSSSDSQRGNDYSNNSLRLNQLIEQRRSQIRQQLGPQD